MLPVNPPPPVKPRYVRGLHDVRMETFHPFIGHYIYCWLKNKRGYWFCPQSVSAASLDGYVWRWGKWRPAKLWMRMIDNFH